ncbi:diguanylate cyclase [Gammaproteobacteria bacterium]|nr:diguanylate cyclase [Gammaproteobacteria bacterium]MDA8799370.1 diguanylate cyclase [Gammaproteobacteria bacterium]
MDKLTPKETSKGAEEIVLTQIKQNFITPANAIFDYVDMVEKVLNEAELQSDDEIDQIKSSCSKLIDQYEVAFVQNTGVNADSSKKSPEEYSELRHNLRTPLNAIIGYSEILMEDYEDDLEESTLEDFQQIINLARETETAIEYFVDYIRGEALDPNNDNSSNQLESAEALFKSLGDIEYSITLDDEIKESDILIVDDNVTNCEVLQRRLSMQGLSCRTAYDGNTAITEVFKKTPDLILLDVILPDINGLELLKNFRKEHNSESLPVIMVSAFNDVDSISKCIQLGAQDYLPKPINGTILLAKVVAALERKFWREREKELVNKLHIQATTDQLTGIYNRRVIFEALDEAMENSRQSQDRQFATIMFDIDFFKQVNDNYGHAGGDAVLISFAQLLQTEISSPNIVGRIGGEEFLAILYLDPDQAKEFCTKLIKKINNNVVNFDGTDIKVSSSGGVAFSTETETSADLTNKADERLYEAKKDGRNRFKLIDTELVGD